MRHQLQYRLSRLLHGRSVGSGAQATIVRIGRDDDITSMIVNLKFQTLYNVSISTSCTRIDLKYHQPLAQSLPPYQNCSQTLGQNLSWRVRGKSSKKMEKCELMCKGNKKIRAS